MHHALQKEATSAKHAGSKPSASGAAAAASSSGSSASVQIVLPPCLTARQRAVLHEVAEAHGLDHVSKGDGADRHLVLGPDSGKKVGACSIACILTG